MKVGRNAVCPCGSGRKYKSCCGGLATTAGRPQVVSAYPDWQRHYEQAAAHVRGGNLAAAEAICTDILLRDRSQHQALNILGSIFHRRGDFGRAAEAFRNAVDLNPGSADYLANLGAALMDLGQVDTAVGNLQEALRLNPEHHLARFMLGNAFCRQARMSEAVQCYREVLASTEHGLTSNALFALITTMLADQDWLRAEDGGNAVIPASPAVRRLIQRLASAARDAGRRAALQEFMRELAAVEVDHFDVACLALLWRQLETQGWYRESPDLPRPLTRERFLQVMGTDTLLDEAKMSVLSLGCLAYKPGSAHGWNRLLCDEYIAPAVSLALESGRYWLAKWLHWETVTSCGQQPLTEETWLGLDAQVRPMFAAAAAKLRRLHPPPGGAEHHNPVPHVAITTDWAITGNSGDGVLLTWLGDLARLDRKPFNATIYALHGISDDMTSRFLQLGIPVGRVGDSSSDGYSGDFVETLLALRARMGRDKVDCLIHVGNYEAVAYLLGGLQMAPAQIFWTTGFSHIDIPYFDGYISGSALGPSTTRSNHAWWQGPPLVEDFIEAVGPAKHREMLAAADRIRAEVGEGKVLLGSIARASKIDNPVFIGALARILRANPQCVFLWCGARQEPESVKALMEAEGIYDKCMFRGWVDGRMMAMALDVHLDVMPFSSGISMYETMSVGGAFAWMDGKEARQVSAWASGVLPWIEGRLGTRAEQEEARNIFIDPATGENLFVIAADVDQFVANVQRLVDDATYRAAVGRAGRSFLERFVFDSARRTQAYGDFIAGIMAKKRGALR